MHELAVTQGVVDTILERIDRKVTGVRLDIGRVSGILPDAVRFCFELACAGTRLEGAWLEIREPEARARCRDCADEFSPAWPVSSCACGSVDVELLSGRELRITAVEVA